MPVMVVAVLTMSAAQLLDLATFMSMVRLIGPEAEVNPIVGTLYGAYGYPMVAVAKVVLLALVTATAAILVARPTRTRLAGGVVALAIVIGILGGLSNALAVGAI